MESENLEYNGSEMSLIDSGNRSKLTIVILPGVEGPKVWRHQYKYFKSDFRTLIVDPVDRSKENYIETVKNLLQAKNLNNCILVGSNTSCFVLDQINDSKRVVSSVFTDGQLRMPALNFGMFKVLSRVSRHPKIMQKLVFCDKTDYSTVKDFVNEVDPMDWSEIKSYQNSEIEGDVENGLLLTPVKSKLSDNSVRNILQPDISVSTISSGSFCFFEKPEEYNKALYDFISKLKNFKKKAEIRETKEANRSLADFEKMNRTKKRRKVKGK